MQQDAQQTAGTPMNLSIESQEKFEKLRKVKALAAAQTESLELLANAAEEVRLGQGQTLLRHGVIETHAFLLLEGTVRLLGKDPVLNDLFTVGKLHAGELVGVVDLLRQAPCEAAIARQPCRLLSMPINLILELIRNDSGLLKGLQNLQSPCEGTAVLSTVLTKMNPPPADTQAWLRDQLKASLMQVKHQKTGKFFLVQCYPVLKDMLAVS